MIQKLCPRCRSVYIPHYARMCDPCAEKQIKRVQAESDENRRARNRKYNRETRDPRLTAFYNSREWKALRAYKLSKDCICEACRRKPAEIAHHIVPIREDWDRRLDFDNLMSVCAACHEEKHPERHSKGGKARGRTTETTGRAFTGKR